MADYIEPVGLLKKATIVKYIPERDVIKARLSGSSAIKGSQVALIEVKAPHSLFHNNGLFIGTMPKEGTPIVVGQGSGGSYHFISFSQEDLTKVPTLSSGVLLISSNDDTRITLDISDNISIGSPINNVHINTDLNYISTNFYNEYNFTQASRSVNGVVKRDTLYNDQFSQNNKLERDDYDSQFKVIGLDPSIPSTNATIGSSKNPPLVENRELIYEFQYLSGVEDDLTESTRYGQAVESVKTAFNMPNRRISRADTLSLSLVAPNYLIETVKGTVVDIFGNILDLNREKLPVGTENATIQSEKNPDKVKSFLSIKELERKSLAYHFEINARKDLIGVAGKTPSLPDINSNSDYSRPRSRFFLDIDKEGQFKLNVPASSRVGNIPLLTRYENYSTFDKEDSGNPNKLIYTTEKRDIYQDSFASPTLNLSPVEIGFVPVDKSMGSIRLVGSDGKDIAPKDRLTGFPIKHGTAYHDILQTCYTHQNKTNAFINYAGSAYFDDTLITSTTNIPPISNVVSDTIIVSGDSANAGGRSGSFNFDGSIEMNIGANDIDRQSLWMDLAGGSVVNLGRDKKGRSAVIQSDGDVCMQIGNYGITADSRFAKDANGSYGGVLDIRILNAGGNTHMIRCDNNGITIMSPGNIAIHANGKLELTSNTEIRMDAPKMSLHGRFVLNGPGMSI